MEVRLNIETIIKDIRTKSHLEVSSVADQTARYRMEAGTEKMSEIKRDVASAAASLVQECYRFLDMPGIDDADNSITDAKELVFVINAGARRIYGKEKALAQKVHEILVDIALNRFYASVSAPDLSKIHSTLSATGIAELEAMLRNKRPPKYIDR